VAGELPSWRGPTRPVPTFFKGSTKMEHYTNFDETPKELDFLQTIFLKTIIGYEPDKIIEPQGIDIEKK